MNKRCSATTRRGLPCRAWAARGTVPPRCGAHGGRIAAATVWPVADPRSPSAATTELGQPRPPSAGDEAARRLYPDYDRPVAATDLDVVIGELQRRHFELVDYIDAHKDEMRPGQYVTAIDYQGRLANRIGRLLRDRQQLLGEQAGEFDEAVDEALAIVGEAWGVALSGKD